MIEFYFWTTPNGHKVTIFLEEAGIPFKVVPVNIGKGEQFEPSFLRIAPNNRVPAIRDLQPADGGEPVSVFESGAVLLYLAEKTGQLIPTDLRGRVETLQWLFWQMAGLGPMAGQTHHFRNYAGDKIPYAIDRFVGETNRLYGVLEKRLAEAEFLAGGSYSIADIACFPWIRMHDAQGQDLEQFPSVARWFADIKKRPAVERAYDLAKAVNPGPWGVRTAEQRGHLFGQTAASLNPKA